MAALKIPGVRFRAVCDVWPYHQRYAANILKEFKQPVTTYGDAGEMLAKERLDAVLIATPDWVHAPQAIAAVRAGCHVYCEKEMATTVADARAMVEAARRAGRLLQIGHQRRSNPRYRHAENLIRGESVLGRITHAYGQWNRSRPLEQGWPKGSEMDAATLRRLGYNTMERLRNWRWYRAYSSGPLADLGSHQVDVFGWFLDAHPEAVLAAGGNESFPDREQPDHVMAIYQYRGGNGVTRAFYQVLNTTSWGGYYETFMGEDGSLTISEDPKIGHLIREPQAEKKAWEDDASKVQTMGKEAIELKVGETRKRQGGEQEALEVEADLRKPPHQPHLENFFGAIRGEAALTCPGEEGFRTCVAILRGAEAVGKGTRTLIDPKEYAI
jgi:predicted dehydrogenase